MKDNYKKTIKFNRISKQHISNNTKNLKIKIKISRVDYCKRKTNYPRITTKTNSSKITNF